MQIGSIACSKSCTLHLYNQAAINMRGSDLCLHQCTLTAAEQAVFTVPNDCTEVADATGKLLLGTDRGKPTSAAIAKADGDVSGAGPTTAAHCEGGCNHGRWSRCVCRCERGDDGVSAWGCGRCEGDVELAIVADCRSSHRLAVDLHVRGVDTSEEELAKATCFLWHF